MGRLSSRQVFGHKAVLKYAPQTADKMSVAASFKRRRTDITAARTTDNTAQGVVE